MVPRPHGENERFSVGPTVDEADTHEADTHEADTLNALNSRPPIPPQHLVLVGGGHAHVQVIKAMSARDQSKLKVTLLDPQPSASYSGMVPGCVARLYEPWQTRLALAPLATWADILYRERAVIDIDLERKLIYLEAPPSGGSDASDTDIAPIAFDAVSLDIGSTTRHVHSTPGAAEHTIPTRPIAALVERLIAAEEEIKVSQEQPPTPVRVVVVGAGVAGLELAMAVQGRWSTVLGEDGLHVTIVDSGPGPLLPLESKACRYKLQSLLRSKRILVRHDCQIATVQARQLVLDSGATIPMDYCIWATGASAHDLARKLAVRGLAVDEHDWIAVHDTLQSVSHPFLFAAGDCAAHPARPPKAGVYAVRSGPILIQNLTSYLHSGTASARLMPQPDFLKLLACGDGTSLGFRFGICLHGPWVWQIKDQIDNAFMDLFRVEHLPTDAADKAKLYDISQYDAAYACKDHAYPLAAPAAAALLWRSDEGVDMAVAWKVVRDMVCMPDYRAQVLQHWHTTEVQVRALTDPNFVPCNT
jgi:selenide,water dikinase